MAISRKSGYEIKLMREAGRVVALVHQEMKNIIKPGVTTKYLDDVAYQVIKDNHCDPTCLGYNGFPATICSSVNEEVVHGIPSDKVVLKDGDVITVDVCATFRGFAGDSAWSYGVGIRFDLSLFIFRIDFGVKLHDPSRISEGTQWRTVANGLGWRDDMTFHFAIGHPF